MRPSKKSTVVETMDQNQNHGIEQIPPDEMAFCYMGINFLKKKLVVPKCAFPIKTDFNR